ncbi:hypothetical protein COO60DRAFT_1642164 [Scenedesmus sp. NREL 46B-D3]|nr:hypothetical protein COO60DRAFT_1642164 [Scenedesmus sp. NREL 46B-D3]
MPAQLPMQRPLGRRRPVQGDAVVIPAFQGINAALQRQARHPLAAHLLIHLTEGGTPGPATSRTMQPGFAGAPHHTAAASLAVAGACGLHAQGLATSKELLGSPRTSLLLLLLLLLLPQRWWHDAVASNKAALQADEAQAMKCVEPYMPQHNASMLQFAAAMSGEYGEALALAQRQVRYPELFGPTNMADGRERTMLPMLYARWARWEELMGLDKSWLDYSDDGVMLPPGAEQFGDGVWHYGRALALASAAAHESDVSVAASLQQRMRGELVGLDGAVAATPADPITKPGDGLGIYSPGFKRLGQIEQLTAGARADALDSKWRFGYTEPPRQYQPLKPCLGWVLLQQGRLAEAEQVYLSDLADLPRNPWALRGLQQVYERQSTPAAAQKLEQVTAQLAAAWAHADAGLSPTSSCPAFSD